MNDPTSNGVNKDSQRQSRCQWLTAFRKSHVSLSLLQCHATIDYERTINRKRRTSNLKTWDF